MEPLQNASKQSAKAMEPQHDIDNGEKSSTAQNPFTGINIISSSKKLNHSFSSNCSSPDTPLDCPFLESDYKYESKPKEVSNDEALDSIRTPAIAANSSSPVSSNLSTTELPSTQVMERPTDESYRIPSSVFGKGKSRKEMEWSSCSNESLFSIQLDNTSLSRDQVLWNPEELCELEESYDTPTENISPVRPSSSKITELTKGDLDTAETSMRDFLKGSTNQNHENCYVEARTSRYSDESGTSGRSFAFPILTGDTDKDTSAKSRPEKTQPQSLPLSKQEEESLQTPQSEQHAAAAPKTWFSCFMCCSFCS